MNGYRPEKCRLNVRNVHFFILFLNEQTAYILKWSNSTTLKTGKQENTDNNLYDAGDTGQGYTSEELFNAVSVVMGAEKRKEDRKKAGEVLSHFEGAEMFDLMCREHDEFSNQFYSLIKEYQDSKIIPRTL